MSALLGHNPIKYESWKGPVVHQITSSLQKNKNTQGDTDFENYRRPLPLKIYRREIAVNIPAANANVKCTSSRVSSSIDELARPNGSLIVATYDVTKGLENVLDIQPPSSKYETNSCAANTPICIADNARRRVRSGGMIKKRYDPVTGDSTYFTNTKQYLTSRSKTFSQNTYTHVRYEDVLINAPLDQTKSNIYIPGGISHCPKTHIVAGSNEFYYYWIDATDAPGGGTAPAYTVTIPEGYYDLAALNEEVHKQMYNNTHYIVNMSTNSPIFLLNFAYNSQTRQIELQLFSSSNYYGNTLLYQEPIGAAWTIPDDNRVVTVEFPATGIRGVFGFSQPFYPPLISSGPNAGDLDNMSVTNIGYYNNASHSIYPSYLPIAYKPSNSRFANQGGVSSSSMTERKKYESINNTATTYAIPFGRQVANALAYGAKEVTYTAKDKMGFPLTRTPVVCKWTGEVNCSQR